MNIAIAYNRDIYALKVLNLLLPKLAPHQVLLLHSARVGAAKADEPAALTQLHQLEQQVLADVAALSDAVLPTTFEQLSQRYSEGDLQFHHVNEPSGLRTLAEFSPDLMLSVRFGKILKSEAIAIPTHGVINLHSGLLPVYRGVMPTFRAMLAGDTHIGTTLHWISDASIDTGSAIGTTRLPVDPNQTYLNHVWRLYDSGVEQLLNAVAAIEGGELGKPSESPPSERTLGSYYSFPDHGAVKRFEERGFHLFRPQDVADICGQFNRGRLG